MFKLLITLFLANSVRAEDRCLVFENCQSSISYSSSAPSHASSSSLNPANISDVRGFGVETIYQDHNPLNFDIVTGNGKFGALVSPNLENSFFGNRSIEIDDLALNRYINKYQYKNKILNFDIGSKIFNKKHFSLDWGVSVKRNPDIKNINPGLGLSARIGIFRIGAYEYKDDVKIDLGNYINPYTQTTYAIVFGGPTYTESFYVTTFTAGIELRNLSLNAGVINTKYKFYPSNTLIYLYSGSYQYQSFLFNYAQRYEYSPNEKYNHGSMSIQRFKKDEYYGVQFLSNKYLMLGLQYNNFLLKELSWTATLFF